MAKVKYLDNFITWLKGLDNRLIKIIFFYPEWVKNLLVTFPESPQVF